MSEYMTSFFDAGALAPHGLCLLWRPELIWLHVISDSIITISYYSIPLVLILYFLIKKGIGQWSGDFRCGPYLLQTKVANPNGWTVTANMTVGNDGHATIVRGDTHYSESVSGDVQADGSATLRGRGANKTNTSNTWTTEVTGRFASTGRDARFDGDASIGSASGEISRRCTVRLTKNSIG